MQNIDGKFAVVYNVRGASCDEVIVTFPLLLPYRYPWQMLAPPNVVRVQVIAFVEAVSKGADVIERSTVKCDDHERIVFHASINSF